VYNKSVKSKVIKASLSRIRFFIGIFTFSIVMGGCASNYSIVEFEVLEPATVDFPDEVQQLIFLNRAPISPVIWDTVNRQELDARQLVLLDTLINNNLNRGILELLRQSPLTRFHMPIWLSDRRLDTIALEDRILTKREVQNICDTIGGDAIISMEYYFVGLNRRYDYYKDFPSEIQNSYYEVYNRLKWNIHLPGSPVPFDTYNTVDTLFFPVIVNGAFVSSELSALDMVRDLFYGSGFKYGRYLVPVWNQASRILYRGRGDSLKLAVKHTDNGDWESAFSLWKGLTLSSDSTMAAKAYHNLAIYYELEDQLDTAIILVDKALELDSLELVKFYREELDVRLLNRKEIEKQVIY
jgi:hypothetical protein